MATNGPGNTFSVFSLLEALRRRKLFVIFPTLLLAAGASIYAYTQPDRYRAQAVLAAEHVTPPEYLRHISAPVLNIQEHLWTVRETLFSQPVLEAAARELNAYRGTDGQLPAETIDGLKQSISVKVESEHTFQISYESPDRHEVMNVTNRLAGMFVQRASAKQKRRAEDTASVINEQLNALKSRLDSQSKQIHEYKQRVVHELPDHQLENMRVVDTLREQYFSKGTKIAEEEARRTSILKEMAELEAKGALDQPMVAEKMPEELRLDGLRIREKELRTRYTQQHPELLQVQREIQNLERAVASRTRTIRSEPTPTYLRHLTLKSELEGIEQRLGSFNREMQSLSAQISGYQRRIEASPKHERALEDMLREYSVGEQQLHALLDKRMEASLAKGLEESESGIAFQVVEPAGLPNKPYSPQRERLILMGIFAGLGLGLVMAFVIEQNDTTFSTVDDFQAFTTLPLIGVIPGIGSTDVAIGLNDPDSVAAEQYRLLAMKVQQHCAAEGTRIVMITSAAGGEGKSLTAINLAMSLAGMADGPVLLVDADMRKPRLHEYLKISVPAGGGFHSLLLNCDENALEYMVTFRNLHVIPGVATSANPVAPLASPKARTLFDRLRKEFKYVIVDAPPTLPIADSHILSGLSDKVLFVVRARKTPRELFQHAIEGFEAGNLLGAVLNDVDYQRSRYAYAYEYYKEKKR